MFTRFRAHLLFGLLAFVCAQGWNRLNIRAMEGSTYARYNVRDGRTLTATDDASYLNAVDVLFGARPDLEQSPYRDHPDLRAPGYRLWYLLPRLVLDPLPALSVLVLLQCLLFAFAVAVLWEVLVHHGIPQMIRVPLVLLLAAMPTFHGFLFHTLTEGVTPALSLLVLSCALLARDTRWLWVGVVLWSLLMVTRPALFWVGFALVPALWEQKASIARLALIAILAFLPTGGWWVGNMVKAGGFVGLHPVYYAGSPGIARPMHGAFWDLAKSWGARGDEFHPVMEDAFRAAMVCDTSSVFAERFLQLAPEHSLTPEQDLDIREAFHRWQRFNCTELAPALRSEAGTIPFTTRTEQGILFTMEKVTTSWRNDHPFHHYVRVPLRVLTQLVVHSNLNLFLFQDQWRGHPLMETLRWSSAALHVLLLACVLLAVFLGVPLPVRWCAVGGCLYLLYLAYVQRGVEERYTLPVLFIGSICAAFVLQHVLRPIFASAHPQQL